MTIQRLLRFDFPSRGSRMMIHVLVAFTFLFVSANSQVLKVAFVRHAIPATGTNVLASTSQGAVVVATSVGAHTSHDGGRSFSLTMTPSQSIRVDLKPAVFTIADSCLLYTGGNTSIEGPATFISHDNGRTWTVALPFSANAAGLVTAPGDGNVRVFDHFSKDSGRTWSKCFPLDEMSSLHDQRFYYLGRGLFVCKDEKSRHWYEVPTSAMSFAKSDIPDSIDNVYRLPDGTVLGIAGRSAIATFHTRPDDDSPFEYSGLQVDEINVIDSVRIISLTPLQGGVVAITYSESHTFGPEDRLLLISGREVIHELQAEDYGGAGATWNGIQASTPEAFVVRLRALNNTMSLLLVTPTTGEVSPVPIRLTPVLDRQSSFSANGIVKHDAIETRGGRVHILDVSSGDIILGGTVEGGGDRVPAIGIDATVSIGEKLFWMDERGDIAFSNTDTQQILVALSVSGMDRHNVVSATQVMQFGVGKLWIRDSALVVGGTRLIELAPWLRTSLMRPDTTSYWIRLSDGTELAGFREVTRRLPGSDQFDTVTTISDGRAVIGAMLQVSQDTVLAALRGYVHTIFEGSTDTIPGGLWRSVDGGETWERISLPVDGEMVLSIQQRSSDRSVWISMRPVQRESIVETGSDGKQTIVQDNLTMGEITLLKSADAGTSWEVVHSQRYSGSFQPSTSNVAFHGANTVVWATHDRVQWSDDNGSSWRLVDGIPGLTTIVGSVSFDTAGALWVATSAGLYKADPVNVSVDETASENDEINEPKGHSTPIFWANTFPNPTDRTFTLRLYNLDRLRGSVDQLEIVDILGRRILDLRSYTDGPRPSGTIDIPLDLGTNASGLYLLVGSTSDRTFTWPMWVH